MIYLSGRIQAQRIGERPDIGIMVGYRPKGGLSHGKAHLSRTVWAADNGCFTNPCIDVTAYLEWLKKLATHKQNCLFATAPDVVGDARATWARSESILPLIRALGYKAALVAQDGIEDYPIRWGAFDVLFIGGTTAWKLSEASFEVARQAKAHGLWVHMGRCNSRRRLRIAHLAGCDSADGTQLAFAPDKKLKQVERWLDEMRRQPFLRGLRSAEIGL